MAAADLTAQDTVLEVGPGPGVLTELLLQSAGRVVAVELDDRLIPFLRARFAAYPNLSLVHGDMLKLDVSTLMTEQAGKGPTAVSPTYKVVANLPYYITGAVIPQILGAERPPVLTVVTVQREVGERMIARPPEMSLLALGVQFYCEARIVDRIPAGAFYPAPKVDSAVVRMRRRAQPAVSGVSEEQFFRVARAGFGQRRKQLRNSLASGLSAPPPQAEAWLRAAGIDPQRRAETLTIEEWGALALAVQT